MRLILLSGYLRAHALLLFPQLGREVGAEIFCLEQLANFNLGLAREWIRAALDPFDRLVLRLHLPQSEAGDQVLRFGERSLNNGALVSGELDPSAI